MNQDDGITDMVVGYNRDIYRVRIVVSQMRHLPI